MKYEILHTGGFVRVWSPFAVDPIGMLKMKQNILPLIGNFMCHVILTTFPEHGTVSQLYLWM
jgi:hypothetical protein